MGSAGSGGGGGSSHSGGGADFVGGTRSGGTFRFDAGRLRGGEISEGKAKEAVGRLTRYFQAKGPYVAKFVEAPGFGVAYDCLFHLVDLVFGRCTEREFAEAMGLSVQSTLSDWANKAGDLCEKQESDREVVSLLRTVLEEFATLAAANDIDLYTSVRISELLHRIDQQWFSHAANKFLGICIRELFTLNTERLPEAASLQLDVLAGGMANKLVAAYELAGGGQVRYRQLAQFFRQNPGWFLDHLAL